MPESKKWFDGKYLYQAAKQWVYTSTYSVVGGKWLPTTPKALGVGEVDVTPPPQGYDFDMSVGEYSPGSDIRGFDDYATDEQERFGTLTPDTWNGADIRRFRTADGLTTLYFGPTVDHDEVRVSFDTGYSFNIPKDGDNSYSSPNLSLWNTFQNNDNLSFNLTPVTITTPPPSDYDFVMQVGSYGTSGTSQHRGYSAVPTVEDQFGALAPDNWNGDNIYRFKCGTNEDYYIMFQFEEAQTYADLEVEFGTGDSISLAKVDDFRYGAYDQDIWQLFQRSAELEFNLTEGGGTTPPPSGDFPYDMVIGEYSPGSVYRGYDGYNEPVSDQYGSLYPNTFEGVRIRRLRTGAADSNGALILYLASAVNHSNIKMILSTGQVFEFPLDGTSEYVINDPDLWNIFQENESLNFDLQADYVLPPPSQRDYIMSVGEYSPGSQIRGFDGYQAEKYGTLTPDTFEGIKINRFRTGNSGNYMTLLQLGQFIGDRRITVETMEGQQFNLDGDGMNFYSYDQNLWLIFQQNSELGWDITSSDGGTEPPLVGDFIMDVGEFKPGSVYRGYDNYTLNVVERYGSLAPTYLGGEQIKLFRSGAEPSVTMVLGGPVTNVFEIEVTTGGSKYSLTSTDGITFRISDFTLWDLFQDESKLGFDLKMIVTPTDVIEGPPVNQPHAGTAITEDAILGRKDILYFRDFDDEEVTNKWAGSSYPYWRWSNEQAQAGRGSIMAYQPEGMNEPYNVSEMFNDEVDEAYMRYYRYYPVGYDFGRIHKAGGMYARNFDYAQTPSCRKPNGYDKYSCRISSVIDGRIILYTYNLDQPENCGEGLDLNKDYGFKLSTGVWHKFELRIKANSVSGSTANPDGELELWIDGDQKALYTDMRFRKTESLKINQMNISAYQNTGTADLQDEDRWLWHDQIVCATGRIDQAATPPPVNPDPPDLGTDFSMIVGAYSPSSVHRGYDGYLEPVNERYGVLSPDNLNGNTIERFKAGVEPSVLLQFDDVIPDTYQIEIKMDDNQYYTFTSTDGRVFYENNTNLWQFFQDRDELGFNIELQRIFDEE